MEKSGKSKKKIQVASKPHVVFRSRAQSESAKGSKGKKDLSKTTEITTKVRNKSKSFTSLPPKLKPKRSATPSFV